MKTAIISGLLLLFVMITTQPTIAQCTLTGQWNVSNTSCPQTPDGFICCVNLTGGTPPYSCSISPNVGQWTAGPPECFTNLPTGTYIITTTDAVGCQGTGYYTIGSVYPALDITFQSSSATCNQANGSVCANVNNGSGNYSFSWIKTPSFTVIGTTQCLTGIDAGLYQVQVTDLNTNCSRLEQIQIESNNLTLSTNTTNSDCVAPNCNGTATLTLTGGTAPYNITWTSGGLENMASQQTQIAIDDLCPGFYALSVIDANYCTAELSFDISQIYQNPTIGLLVSPSDCPAPFCNGIVWLSATIQAPFTIQWSEPSLFSPVTFDNSIYKNGLCEGIYSGVLTNASGCTTEFSFIIENSGEPMQCDPHGIARTMDLPYNAVGVELHESSTDPTIRLWPNPCSNTLYANLPNEAVRVEWLDMAGRILKTEQTFYPKQTFDIRALAPGNYLMRAVLEDGSSAVQRVVKAE